MVSPAPPAGGEEGLATAALDAAAVARIDLRLGGPQRLLDRDPHGMIRGGGMDVGTRDAEQHAHLKTRAGLALVSEAHHRLLNALAGGQGKQETLNQALDGGAGTDVTVVEEKFHGPPRYQPNSVSTNTQFDTDS